MFDLLSSNSLIQSMDKGMTLATRRMALIASNMANIDTPGYRTQDFDFAGALKHELAQLDGKQMPITQTHPMHFALQASSSLPPTTDEIRPNYERNDGNDVSLDRESQLLARTQNAYTLASNFAQVELRKLRQMIRDART
jgi:flagellar basal-body rod protein FlgB